MTVFKLFHKKNIIIFITIHSLIIIFFSFLKKIAKYISHNELDSASLSTKNIIGRTLNHVQSEDLLLVRAKSRIQNESRVRPM